MPQQKSPHIPSEEDRGFVRGCAAAGWSLDKIGSFLIPSISGETVAKHYQEELSWAKTLEGKLANLLLLKALDGDNAALFFALKTRFGWRETTKTELSGSVEVQLPTINFNILPAVKFPKTVDAPLPKRRGPKFGSKSKKG